jgi:hypothetical protein
LPSAPSIDAGLTSAVDWVKLELYPREDRGAEAPRQPDQMLIIDERPLSVDSNREPTRSALK